jgi:hypothetical protein
MRTFTLNIGTEIGTNHGNQADISPAGIEQIVRDTLDELTLDCIPQNGITYDIESKMSPGGDWEAELILVVTVRVPLNDFEGFWFTLLELVRATGQDCIAIDGIDHKDGGYMLFHPRYDGWRFAFDRTYFVK